MSRKQHPSQLYLDLNNRMRDLQCEEICFRMLINASKGGKTNIDPFLNNCGEDLYVARVNYLYAYFDALENQIRMPSFYKIDYPSGFQKDVFLKNTSDLIAKTGTKEGAFYENISMIYPYTNQRADRIRTLSDMYHTPYIRSEIYPQKIEEDMSPKELSILYPLAGVRSREDAARNQLTRRPSE